MERFEEAKKEWSEPQMVQLGLKETESGTPNPLGEGTFTGTGGNTTNLGS